MDNKYKKIQMLLEITSLLLVMGAVIYVGVKWTSLPEIIPIHFDIKGQPDGYGGKGNIIFVVVIGIILYMVMSIAQKNPQSWNLPVTINDDNKEKVYAIFKMFIIAIKLEVNFIYTYMIVKVVQCTALNGWFMFGLVMLVFVTLFTGIYFCRKA